MANGIEKSRQFWLGFALLVLVGVFLGLKTQQAVSLVLDAKNRISVAGNTQQPTQGKLLARVRSHDDRLKDTVSLQRDPFGNPRSYPAQGNPVYRPSGQTTAVPTLRALLYDNVNPIVQLSTGAQTSDWLRKGDSFQGWVVAEIGPDSVRISRNDESVVLSTS